MKNQKVKEFVCIDDDPLVLKIYEILFKRNEVTKAYSLFNNPNDALDYLKRYNDSIILFLDINMPQMNAWVFLDHLLEFNKKFDIYIVTSSCSEYDKKVIKGYSNIIGFIEKPFTKEVLESILNFHQLN
jgi:two-component SAPR family response regulator